jgi:plastocyanin
VISVAMGCSDDGPPQTPSAPPVVGSRASSDVDSTPVVATGTSVTVVALDNSFRPQSLEITVGDQVVWENRGRNEHNVLTVEGDGFGVATVDFQPGATFSHVFDQPGEYAYYCSIHGDERAGMIGTIIVNGSPIG